MARARKNHGKKRKKNEKLTNVFLLFLYRRIYILLENILVYIVAFVLEPSAHVDKHWTYRRPTSTQNT